MILVTGGAGSIGSEVVRDLLRRGYPLRVMDINEEGLWLLQSELPDVETFLGDVQSPADVIAAMTGCEAVVHCAAMKHVHLCEQNPRIAQSVNEFGTRNVVGAANGKRVVFLSTDKALEPTCVMGHTKAAAEDVVNLAHNGNIVRFGNVLGSRGSLLPQVIRCRDLGIPIPLTDPQMTRFFMSIEEAVEIILEALVTRRGGRTFSTADPRSARVLDVLTVCREVFDVHNEIVEVGARPGERTHEWLMTTAGEMVRSDDERFLMGSEEIEALLGRAIPVITAAV